jgi:hypothetical protein
MSNKPTVHHVIRIAASDTPDTPVRTHNGVAPEDLQEHLDSNKKIRPSAALFVDGECVFEGTLQQDHIKRARAEIGRMTWKVDILTKPYR